MIVASYKTRLIIKNPIIHAAISDVFVEGAGDFFNGLP